MNLIKSIFKVSIRIKYMRRSFLKMKDWKFHVHQGKVTANPNGLTKAFQLNNFRSIKLNLN